MTRYRINAIDCGGVGRFVTIEVDAPNRGRAITLASRRLGVHRDEVTSAVSLTPASGGGSRRG